MILIWPLLIIKEVSIFSIKNKYLSAIWIFFVIFLSKSFTYSFTGFSFLICRSPLPILAVFVANISSHSVACLSLLSKDGKSGWPYSSLAPELPVLERCYHKYHPFRGAGNATALAPPPERSPAP